MSLISKTDLSKSDKAYLSSLKKKYVLDKVSGAYKQQFSKYFLWLNSYADNKKVKKYYKLLQYLVQDDPEAIYYLWLVTKKRWIEAERVLRKDKQVWKLYVLHNQKYINT